MLSSRSSIPRVPSPQPRPSTSSNRSFRKTEADFEAALLRPEATIYLSGSPPIDEEDTGSVPLAPALALGPLSSVPSSGQGERDEAPLPIEKRSFDEDLNYVERKRSSADGRYTLGKGRIGVPAQLPMPSVIPPTPASASASGRDREQNGSSRHARRDSQMTVGSGNSTTTATGTGSGTVDAQGNGSRRTSLGIDAEIAADAAAKQAHAHSHTKRRSIFRSPGTASSPDLATLVRKAKEAKAVKQDGAPSSFQNPSQFPSPAQPQSTPPAPTPTNRALQKAGPSRLPPTPTQNPQRSSSTQTIGSRPPSSPAPSTSASPAPSRQQSRERSLTTSSRAAEETMEKYGRMMGGNQMASIAEGQKGTTLGRNRQISNDEGFKSMRNRAKGVLGKMFGSNSNKDHLPPTSPSAASSSRFRDDSEQYQPPVPSIPAAYAKDNGARHPSPMGSRQNSDVFSDDQPPTPGSQMRTPSTASQHRGISSPEPEGRASVTPTGSRNVSYGSNLSVDKPLPAVHDAEEEEKSRRRTASAPHRGSMHIRQPASTIQEDDSPPPPDWEKGESSRPSLSASPPPQHKTIASFSNDMADMLASIGQTDPARELGLPPGSLRKKDKERSASMETAREPHRSKFPSDLGRSTSVIEGPKHLLTPILSPRASSLPGGTESDLPPGVLNRTASSPKPSISGEATLAPVSTSAEVSRSSSRSSTKRSKEAQDGKASTLPAPVTLNSPVSSEISRGVSDDLSPLLPTSMKLVSPPQFEDVNTHNSLDMTSDALVKSTFINTSPWGKQSNPPRPDSQDVDGDNEHLEEIDSVPVTPDRRAGAGAEDDEEKGRRLACEFLENNFVSVPPDKVAEFLGGPRPVNGIALRYYMQYFDMKNQNLVDAFRDLCQKLHLKAESQEIDRIIEAFSARYYECNNTTVFGTPGVVHTVTAAMLMLNTDLHIAELNKHMSRADFVRNAMRAIQESMPAPDRSSTPDLIRDDSSSVKIGFGSTTSMTPSFVSMRSKPPQHPPSAVRSASAPVVTSPPPHGPIRTESASSIATNGNINGLDVKTRGSSTTVSSFSYSKAWESEAENALREIYSSVRNDRILLPISGTPGQGNNRQSMISIASNGNGPYDGRNRTVRSPSDRLTALKRGSIRGVQGLLNNPYGSQWSAADGRLSPTPSYATSINEGFGSFAPTLGFASNLSHSVIKEQEDEIRSIDSRASISTAEDMDDDELALLGAPWAKEGILSRKLYWESAGKRAKKADWKQYFVVISKGELYMFTFGDSKGGGGFGGGSVGGGNWLANANAVGTISLMHTMTMALPKPGYNANRPYCFSVALPNGETSFFQAGTEDLVGEWVSACNYWAARKSRQPLQGGVSNMEYGWNRVHLQLEQSSNNNNNGDNEDDRASLKSTKSNLSRLGFYGRKSHFNHPSSAGGTASGGNDRIYINDWKPPPAATMPSPLDEESQLEALQSYIRNLVDELEQHKSVEESMTKLFSNGSKNLHKAKENWRTKSHYIHTEIYKYETYVEALRNAISLRVKKQGEKKLEKSLARSMTSLHRTSQEQQRQHDGLEGEGEHGEWPLTPTGPADATIRR